MIVQCPQCQDDVNWHQAAHRPFCSERCKLIDLGAWASGDYVIGPGGPADATDLDSEHDL